MKENPYLAFNVQMLKSFEAMYKEDMRDSTLTPKKQANAKTKLNLVREALKQK